MAESFRTLKENSSDKHRKRQKNREKGDMNGTKVVEEGPETIPECAVCLQTCVHPAKLPCSHIFCFLCLKGLATQSRRCAMCRQDIPVDYLDHPQLLDVPTQAEKEAFADGYQWFYEGRSGWWQYDERTSRELESAFKSGQRTCELLIVGQLYIADFDAMLQLRRNDMSRRRRIKRDLASIPKKGIAGLRLNETTNSVADTIDVAAVPSTSHPLSSRRDSSLDQSQDNDTEPRDRSFYVISPQYEHRDRTEFHPVTYQSAEETEEAVGFVEEHMGIVEERENRDGDLNENSDTDQAELTSQLSNLWLN